MSYTNLTSEGGNRTKLDEPQTCPITWIQIVDRPRLISKRRSHRIQAIRAQLDDARTLTGRLRSDIQMSIERAEKLKEALTDKFVVVDADVPELRRFQNWTGKVRTVNMNCRALVEFDGPVDIGWYDIDPDYLKIVDAPIKKVTPPSAAKAAPAEAKPAPKPASPAGKSPLDAIRAQQAAKSGAPAAAAPPTGAKPSPLDMIRKQQAAKATMVAPAEAAAPAAPVEPAPAAADVPPAAAPAKALPTTGPDGKPLSKLDLIRMQGAKK